MPDAREGNPSAPRKEMIDPKTNETIAHVTTHEFSSETSVENLDTTSSVHQGLMLAGVVVGRNRRYVGNDQREVVDYKILAGDTTYCVSEWAPKEYTSIGWDVFWPVTIGVRTFNGTPRYTLTRNSLEPSNF